MRLLPILLLSGLTLAADNWPQFRGNHQLTGVNAAAGKGLWTFSTGAEIKSSPVVVGDRVLIGSYDGGLYCLSAKDGKLLWKAITNGYVHSTPPVADGIAYIAGCD